MQSRLIGGHVLRHAVCKSACAATALLLSLAACVDAPSPAPPVHDNGDKLFLALVSIARRTTLPTQSDGGAVFRIIDEIKASSEACAHWKLDQIMAAGAPLAVEAMSADYDGQQRIKLIARRKMVAASNLPAPAACDGHGFPIVSFDE